MWLRQKKLDFPHLRGKIKRSSNTTEAPSAETFPKNIPSVVSRSQSPETKRTIWLLSEPPRQNLKVPVLALSVKELN